MRRAFLPAPRLWRTHRSLGGGADGQRFLAITPRATTTEGLTIVQNWPALLKKQAHHRRSAGGISKSRLHGDVTNRRSPNATSLVIW
jgi:hypothetical protein